MRIEEIDLDKVVKTVEVNGFTVYIGKSVMIDR